MSTTKQPWQASPLEYRSALGIALVSILLVITAAAKPQWFDFSAPDQTKTTVTQKPTQISNQAATAAISEPPSSMPLITPEPIAKTEPIHSPSADRPAEPHQSTPPVTSPVAAGYYIQLGAFKERSRAQHLVQQLQKYGWHAIVNARKHGLHAVWVGPKQTHTQANSLRQAIHSKLKMRGFIIHQKAS